MTSIEPILDLLAGVGVDSQPEVGGLEILSYFAGLVQPSRDGYELLFILFPVC